MDRPAAPWRQSLAAGLLLGLALGCGWLAHWTPRLYSRLVLAAIAAVLALVAVGLVLSLSENRSRTIGWQRGFESRFGAATIPFFSVLALVLLAAVVSGNNLLYLMASGLLAVLAVSGLASALNLSGMELRFRLPAEIFACQPATVGFQLLNAKSFWPAYSLTVSAASRPVSAPGLVAPMEAGMQPVYFAYLPRRARATAASDILFPRRGRYTSAAFILSTRFPFGLLHKHRRFQASGREPEMLVYPRPRSGLRLSLPAPQVGAALPGPGRGDGQDLYRIRAHQHGDSARHVHWKASARARALRVREFSDDAAQRVRLRLALPPDLDPERAEAALSLCAGWLLALDRHQVSLEFVGENATPAAAGLFLPLAPAATHRHAILEYLALVDPSLPAPPHPPFPLAPDVFEIALAG